jgi:acyl-CoA dehydrogenase
MSSLVVGEAPGRAAVLGDLTRRAQAAAAVAAQHAGRVDSEACFPAEAFEAIKAQRLLGIAVPASLGGDGAAISDVADVCYRLGQACSATGMIYAMHQVKVGCVVRHHGEKPELMRLLRQLCDQQLLLASSTTEGQGGGNVRSSEAAVEHHGDRISLERRASVISYGAHADGLVTTARRTADADASDQVLLALLKSDYTLTRTGGWVTLGMRGTCSEGFLVKVNASPEQILPEPYESIHSRTMVPFAHLLWGSVWAGIASAAVARAQAFTRHVMRQSGGTLPPGAQHFTRALASLRTLRSMLTNSLRSYESRMDDAKALGSLEFQSLITLTKVEASELAVATVSSAMRACGLAGYRCDGDFSIERQLRDVLSSPIMIHNDRILANLATQSLVAPVPGSVRD